MKFYNIFKMSSSFDNFSWPFLNILENHFYLFEQQRYPLSLYEYVGKTIGILFEQSLIMSSTYTFLLQFLPWSNVTSLLFSSCCFGSAFFYLRYSSVDWVKRLRMTKESALYVAKAVNAPQKSAKIPVYKPPRSRSKFRESQVIRVYWFKSGER